MEYLQKAIDFIEENVGSPISIDDCAAAAGFSKYHFYRLFGMYVGVPVMDYVRKRRLEHAMLDICRGRRILDVALDYEYSSQRSFSRAFLQEFGKNPSKFRGMQYSISCKPTLCEMKKNLYGGVFMDTTFSEVRFVDLKTMYVASAQVISGNPEDEVIGFMMKWAGENGIPEDARKFGFDVPVSEEDGKKGFRGYAYWICIDENAPVGIGMVRKKVEGCRYAVLRITDPFSNPFEKIPAGWKRLVDWVCGKGYKASCEKERYWLEEVITLDGVTCMDVYFPIE